MAVYEFPTSFGQQWVWLLAQMDPGEPVYNIAWALWLDGPLDVSVLQQAWDAALVRHEALRTTFKNESGMPLQVIEDEPTPQPLLVTSVEELPAGEREPAARALILDVARIPFDLATGPLVRAALVRLSPEAHVLAMVVRTISFRTAGRSGSCLTSCQRTMRRSAAAAARLPRNRPSSTPTSPSGSWSTPRTGGMRWPSGSGGPRWPMPRRRCRCRRMNRTRRARLSPPGASTPRSTPG